MFLNVLNAETDASNGERRAEPDEKTESMEAGYNALFQPEGEDGMNKFFQVKEELANQGVSPTSRQLKYDLHDQETKQIEQTGSGCVEQGKSQLKPDRQMIDIQQQVEVTVGLLCNSRGL